MDFKQIQELIKTINKSNIGELRIEEEGFKIVIKQKNDEVVQSVVSVPTVAAAPIAVAPVAAATPAAPTEAKADESNFVTIKSPMIGTFYRRPSPDKPNFSEVGDSVNVGSVVCIVEAMKLFNEIESEVSGKIVKILVDDATPVEFDQPLFLVDPQG